MLAGAEVDNVFVDAMRRLVAEAVHAEKEKRGFIRVPFFREVVLRDTMGQIVQGDTFCRDIAPNGIGVLHSQPLDDEMFSVSVEAEDGQLNFSGRCVWTEPAGHGKRS